MAGTLTFVLIGAAVAGALLGAPLEFYGCLTTLAGLAAGRATSSKDAG